MSDAEKLAFCSISSTVKFCSYYQESNKENSDFSTFENIIVTISLDGILTHMQKPAKLKTLCASWGTYLGTPKNQLYHKVIDKVDKDD